jgi:hypothetical protein
MTAGRPTLYTPELLEAANTYARDWENIERTRPSIAGLALYLNIARETVRAWSNSPDKEEFSVIVERILTMQEQVLFDKGLTGDFNASIVKLGLTKHGYSDKLDGTLSGGDKPIEVVERRIVRSPN